VNLIDLDSILDVKQRADVASINGALIRLAGLRLDKINLLDEPYRKSKVAWKIAMFSNSVTYRFCSLADGTAIAWNADNMLGTVLCSRALTETVALLWEFADRFLKLAEVEDFGAVDTLATAYLFGTRDEELLKDNPELHARQILKAIDHVDRVITGFRSHYDRLSEFCHPNSWGHRGLFSDLDHKTGMARFGQRNRDRFIVPVICALGTADLFASNLEKINQAVVVFAEAHHRSFPSPL
jgi:hypothetical protein